MHSTSHDLDGLVSTVSQHVALVLLGRELLDEELQKIVQRVRGTALRETPQTLTPPQVAKRLRVSPDKVLAWIRSGELRAVDVASRGASRPRYRVTLDELRVFENRRSTHSSPTPPPRRSRDTNVKRYF